MIEQIFQFALNHWILTSALLVTLALIFWEELRNKARGTNLSLSDATSLINRERAVWVDIRDTTAFEAGHITNALNLPQADIANQLEKLKKYRDKPIILVDDAGRHTSNSVDKLRKDGFSKTYSLMGGLLTWKNAGLPLIKK